MLPNVFFVVEVVIFLNDVEFNGFSLIDDVSQVDISRDVKVNL